ncbi:MAG TPA: Gx transporter family protein [Clostridia bacterium]|jgi:heptaprenyl diphosphate synthase|nr:MAG: Heptaprenyl diphosphate synthase component I [Firmicutes bacterium ADurb.Bin146]HOD92368.1 Gx transporter family protein [Clostridia bacterium]HQM38635.1 Gx transporter family protein [Clostridia bacterium]
MNNTKKLTISAIFTALAIAISIAESYIPYSAIAPGVKLGLANVIPMTLLYVLGPLYAISVQAVRIIVTGLLRGNLVTFFFSFFGGMASTVLCALIKKQKIIEFSVIGLSVIGAVIHNTAQFFTALVILKNINILWYIAILAIFAVIAGVLTGIIAKYTIKAIERYSRSI